MAEVHLCIMLEVLQGSPRDAEVAFGDDRSGLGSGFARLGLESAGTRDTPPIS